ncbi:WhiB family transcriptional regulator [Streptomyces bobili]|uniref:WhiB family transcriptional regulator n=1 Tax=Streptomyces bobili TaxID=67280 RepID=UPI00381E929A
MEFFSSNERLSSWMGRAACADRSIDPLIFYPPIGGHASDQLSRAAKRICSGCPVRQECLHTALIQEESHGVWGGLSARERERIFKKQPQSARSTSS